MTMTKDEIQKVLKSKRECIEALDKYMNNHGETLPNGEDAFQRKLKYLNEVKGLEYELEQAEALSDDEIIALAQGKDYMSEDQKKKQDRDRKQVRSLLGLDDEDEDRKEIREMIGLGS